MDARRAATRCVLEEAGYVLGNTAGASTAFTPRPAGKTISGLNVQLRQTVGEVHG